MKRTPRRQPRWADAAGARRERRSLWAAVLGLFLELFVRIASLPVLAGAGSTLCAPRIATAAGRCVRLPAPALIRGAHFTARLRLRRALHGLARVRLRRSVALPRSVALRERARPAQRDHCDTGHHH